MRRRTAARLALGFLFVAAVYLPAAGCMGDDPGVTSAAEAIFPADWTLGLRQQQVKIP